MHFRFLIFGILVHGIVLLWSYDIYGKSASSDLVPCRDFVVTKADDRKRLLLAVVRNANNLQAIHGLGEEFFRRIPTVIYIGESLLPEFYKYTKRWTKSTYQTVWHNAPDNSDFIFSALKEKLSKINVKKLMYFLVIHKEVNERNQLYLAHELVRARHILDEHYGDNRTCVLLYFEDSKVLFSSGFATRQFTGRLTRHADVAALVSALLSIDIPYQSMTLLPTNYLISTKDQAIATFCNALCNKRLADDARLQTGLLRILFSTNTPQDIHLNTTIGKLLAAKNYTGALYLSKTLQSTNISRYLTSKRLTTLITFIFVSISLIGWILLLALEYIQLSSLEFVDAPRKSYLLHALFIGVSLMLVGIPLVQSWPYTYHFYFQIPILIIWLISLKIKYLFSLKWTQKGFIRFLLFLSAILLTVEFVLVKDTIFLPLSVCLVALLPSLPKFRQVPFIFIIGWFALSAILLPLIFLVKRLEPSTKYINLCGTIWLLFAGLAFLWIKPKIEKMIICIETVLLASTLWLQVACLAADNCQILQYCIWPLFSVILLPIFGKSSAVNKLVQCTFAFSIPVMLMSTKIEPLTLLILLVYTTSWSAIESYYSISNWDNLRRTFVSIYLFNLAQHLTKTDQLAFKCLICTINRYTYIFIFILNIFRSTIIYTSILCVYRLVLGSQLHAYSSAVLSSSVLAIATFRCYLPFANYSLNTDEFADFLAELVRINTMSIIMIVSYTVASLYARNNKHLQTPSELSLHLIAI